MTMHQSAAAEVRCTFNGGIWAAFFAGPSANLADLAGSWPISLFPVYRRAATHGALPALDTCNCPAPPRLRIPHTNFNLKRMDAENDGLSIA